MTPRVDAHQHFWKVSRGDYFWMSPDQPALYRDFGPADLAPRLESGRIDATVTVQAAPTIAESRFMLDIAASTPWVAGVVGWVDFESPAAADDLAALASDPKLVGVRPMIQDIPDHDWMLRRELDAAFAAIAEAGLVFDALVFPRHLKNLSTLLDRHPTLQVVIDHCAKPQIRDRAFQPWAADMKRLARETAAFCKFSALVTEASADWSVEDLRPYAEHVLAEFGTERLVWGSDWPVCTLAASYEQWLRAAEELMAPLAPAERDKVFGGNAVRLYRLDRPGRLAGGASSGERLNHRSPAEAFT